VGEVNRTPARSRGVRGQAGERLQSEETNLVAGLSDLEPPGFVQLVAHPLRWRLLRELIRSDRAVRELTERLDQPQNLISYHLRKLREGGLVKAQRSSADGRDAYYAIDLASCEQQLRATGAALHPALTGASTPVAPDEAPAAERRRVLFLCTGNSARSQIAEALITSMSGDAVKAASAGSHPKPLHPNAIRAMRKRGIDISGNRTKHLDEFVSQRFDAVITLCDRVREVCPEFPAQPTRVHWSIPDPAQAGPTNRASYPAFEHTAAELETRIRFLVPLLREPSAPNKTKEILA
jgi:ArsR family transcriptional regulator, arsenate/arsenite/antimonite-responsive transcriptional repressor / arsenate reductase (thioredoxin)